MLSIPTFVPASKSNPRTILLVALVFLASGTALAVGGIFYYTNAPAAGRTSIRISESFNAYTIAATYDPRNTPKVQAYIQQRLKDYAALSTDGGAINAHIISGDKISFRIRSIPGVLYMVLYKERSVPEAHALWRQMSERLKTLIL